MPGTPAFAAAGLPGYGTRRDWHRRPGCAPKFIVERLFAAINAILSTADAREWFAVGGGVPGGEAPEVFATLIRAEHAKWPDHPRVGIKPGEGDMGMLTCQSASVWSR